MKNKLKRIVAALILVAAARTLSTAADRSAWDDALDAVKKERFIPVELWTGEPWDGARELNASRADTRFGDRSNKQIKGPTEWKHPVTGETLLVYERRNQEKQGVKVQLFAINEAKNGLGRVYDSRSEFGTRTFSGGLKFPLGYWQQGETRQLEEKRYEGAKAETRIESITITQLDFNYRQRLTAWNFTGCTETALKSSIIRPIRTAPTGAWCARFSIKRTRPNRSER